MTTSYKTFAHDRRRGWIAELTVEAADGAELWTRVDAALRELEARGYTPLDPYAAPVAARVAANLAGQALPAAQRGSSSAEEELPVCPVHNVRMDRHENAGKAWYSHRLPGGEWCNGRPSKGNGKTAKEAELF